MSKYTEDDLKVELENKEYEYGFYTNLDSETFPAGLNEDIIRAISKKKEEPKWMTEWRLEDNGMKILCDKKSFLYLIGTTLEYSGGLNGKGFVFNNPNAQRTCGCGESFSL